MFFKKYGQKFLERSWRGLLAIALLSPAGATWAQVSDWPNKPIRWIVPYQAGTAPDISARTVAEAMSSELKQSVIVDNRVGAGGNIGAQAAARSAPDGYTWLYSASPMAINMSLYKAPGFDAMKDFTHISQIGASDVLVVVNAASGIRSLDELIGRMRQQPNRLNYASGGVGSTSHLGTELMLAVAGVQATHVPYKGAVEVVNAVIGKQVDFSLPIFQIALPQVQSGKLLALGVAGPRRNPKLPEVPTLQEAGLAGVSMTSIGGLSVPSGTPAPVVNKIYSALRVVLSKPDVRSRIEQGGSTIVPSSPESYTEELRAEIARTERMMKLARMEAQ